MAIAKGCGVACAFAFVSLQALAAPVFDQAVDIGGARALLNLPELSRASIILVPGADGHLGIRPDGSFSRLHYNQLARTRKDYLKHSLATLLVDRDVSIAAAIAYMRMFASPVVLVATSRGTLRVPAALAGKPDGIVLTSAFLGEIRTLVATPAALPQTLIIHHRHDGCDLTPPSAVGPFEAWGSTKVAVQWLTGGINSGDPCGARSYHGFNGLDDLVVSTIAHFANAAR